MTVPRLLLVAMITAWAVYFSRRTIDIHHGLGTSSYDLGLYDQGIWLLSRGRTPFVTLMGRNLFGDHASFILLLIVPLYWVWPSVSVLLVLQSAAVALGALPVFLVARRFLHSEVLALAMAAAFLLHPAVGWANLENFHPDSFLAFFVGMAIYAALDHRWRTYTVFVVLALLVKEDVALVIVPLGVWLAANRQRRIGMVTIAGAAASAAFGTLVVMRGLTGVPTRNAWRIPFGGLGGFLAASVTRPGEVLRHFRSEGRPFYLWQMLLPTAFVIARYPWVAAISGLVLFTNVLSTFWYQFHVEYHYSLVAVPALMIGAAVAISRCAARRHRLLVALVVAASLRACLMWGAVPINQLLAPAAGERVGRDALLTWPADHPVAVEAHELMARIPADASVSVLHSLAPHLTHRTSVYQFPTPFRAVLYGSDDRLEARRSCLPAADGIEYVMLPRATDAQTAVDWAAVSADFGLAAENDGFRLFRRERHDVRCAGGTLTARP